MRACIALLFVCATAHAEIPFEQIHAQTDTPPWIQPVDANMFPSLGSANRMWELESNTTYDTNRTFTQRFELSHIVGLIPYKKREHGVKIGLVLRTNFGAADAVTTGFYNLQGPTLGIGIRARTPRDDHWFELGLRVLFPYPGPQNTNPEMLGLALGSVLSSGVGDDASWLPFDAMGAQLYVFFQTRTGRLKLRGPHHHAIAEGAWGLTGGGYASLGALSVASWLGSQSSFIGNVVLEGFVTVATICSAPVNLQFGAHAEASLSGIWEGNDGIPVVFNGFVGWSPIQTVAVRFFYGPAMIPLLGPQWSQQYGARLQLFFR